MLPDKFLFNQSRKVILLQFEIFCKYAQYVLIGLYYIFMS